MSAHAARHPPASSPGAAGRHRAGRVPAGSAGVLAAPTRHKVETLDGLRGLAVLLVLWAHAPILNALPPLRALNQLARPGYLGVDVFFVLSGFLITRNLLHGRCHGTPLTAFFVRRAARIAPIYLLTVAATSVCAAGPYLPWCALYLSNVYFAFVPDPAPLRHTWSLCVEAHFYLVWPFLLYAVPARRHALLAGAVVAAGFLSAAALAAACPPPYGPALIYRLTVTRMASLGIGALFAVCEPRISDARWRRKWAMRLACGAAGLLACGLAVYVVGAGLLPNAGSVRTALQMAGFTLASAALFLAAAGANGSGSWFAVVLAKGLLPRVGHISYGVYLYHYPLFLWLGVLDDVTPSWGGAAAAAVALCVTFAVAGLSHRFIEQPAIALGAGAAPLDNVMGRRAGRALPGVAATR